MDGDMDYVTTKDNHIYRRNDERDVRACSSPESSAMEPGIEAHSADQGRAGKACSDEPLESSHMFGTRRSKPDDISCPPG